MLFLLIAWIVLMPIAFVLGAAVLHWLQLNTLMRLGDRLILATWVGTITLSCALLAAALMMPLTPLLGAIVAGGLLAIALRFSDAGGRLKMVLTKLPWEWTAGFAGVMGAIAALYTRPVIFTDFGLYHYQVMQWMAKYGVVPGLGLLHMRFSYSFNNWFTLPTAFNAGFLEARIGSLSGGFATTLILLHCLICIRRIVQRRSILADWFIVVASLLFVPPLFYAVQLPISSSPDLPVAALTVLLVWAGILATAPDQQNPDFRIPFVLAICALACKISALPLILITGLFLLLSKKHYFVDVLRAATFGVILLPGIAYGIKTIGLPLAPLPFLRLDLPWSVSIERAEIDRLIIQTWGRWQGFPDSLPKYIFPVSQEKYWPDMIAAFKQVNSPWEWVPFWFGNAKMPALMVVTSVVCAVVLCLPPIARTHPAQMRYFVLAVGLGGILFQFSTAPDVRYGMGYFCLTPAFLIAIACIRQSILALTGVPVILGFANRWNHPPEALWSMGIGAIAAVPLYFLMQKSFPKQQRLIILTLLIASIVYPLRMLVPFDLASSLLLPPAAESPAPEKLKTVQRNNFTYLRPIDNRCWAAPLPCTPGPAQESMKLRDPNLGLAGGFARL